MSSQPPAADLVRRNPEQVFAEAGGEILMMHPNSGRYYGLNEVGTFIWHQLARSRHVDEIVTAVGEAFEVEPSACRRDTEAFLTVMIARGLVQRIGTEAGD